MPRQRANRTGGGRLRVTDDTAITVGAEVEVRPEHLRALNVTKTKENAEETRKSCFHILRLHPQKVRFVSRSVVQLSSPLTLLDVGCFRY